MKFGHLIFAARKRPANGNWSPSSVHGPVSIHSWPTSHRNSVQRQVFQAVFGFFRAFGGLSNIGVCLFSCSQNLQFWLAANEWKRQYATQTDAQRMANAKQVGIGYSSPTLSVSL